MNDVKIIHWLIHISQQISTKRKYGNILFLIFRHKYFEKKNIELNNYFF